MLRCIAMSVSRWEINHTKTKLSLYSLCFVFAIEFMFLIIVVHFALFRSFSQRHDAVKRSYCWRKKKTSRSDQNRNQSTSFRYFTVSLSISFFLSFLLLLFFCSCCIFIFICCLIENVGNIFLCDSINSQKKRERRNHRKIGKDRNWNRFEKDKRSGPTEIA